jgi:hypothetical protein
MRCWLASECTSCCARASRSAAAPPCPPLARRLHADCPASSAGCALDGRTLAASERCATRDRFVLDDVRSDNLLCPLMAQYADYRATAEEILANRDIRAQPVLEALRAAVTGPAAAGRPPAQ